MPATENLKFEVELKMSGSSDFVKQLKTQLEEVNTAVKTMENSLNKGLGICLDDIINKAKQLSNTLVGIDSSKSGSGNSSAIGVKVDLTPLITVLNHVETQLKSSMQSVSSNLQQSAQNSASVLEQVKLIRTKLYEIGSKFGVSAVSAGAISPSAIPVNPGNSSSKNTVIIRETAKDPIKIEPIKVEPIDINVSCQCSCGNTNLPRIDPVSKKPILPAKKTKEPPKPPEPNPAAKGSNTPDPNPVQKNSDSTFNIEYLEKISGYLAAFSSAISAIGVYSAYAYDKTVDLKESLYAVTLSASQTQAALETVSQQQVVSGYTTEQLKDATILLERMGSSAKRYLPIAVNVAQKTGNKLAVVAEDLAGALNSLEALEAFQSKYNISNHDLERNGAIFKDGNIQYDYASDRMAAGEALSKALEQSFSGDNNVNTYGEAVNNLQNSIEALTAKVGEQLLPVFIQFVSLGEEVVNWVESLDSSFIGSVSGIIAFTGAVSGIIPVVSKLLPILSALPANLVALGPYGWIAAGLVAFAGYSMGKESSAVQQSLKELESVRQESSEMTKIIQLAREFAEQKEIALKHGLSQVEVENKLGDELSNNVKKLEEIQGNIDAIKKKRARFLGDYTDYDDLKKAYSDTESQLKDKDKEYSALKDKLKTAYSKRTRLPITFQMGMVEKERDALQAKLDDLAHRKKMVKFYDNTLSKIEPYVDNAQKKIDTLSVLEKDVERMKKAVSTAEGSGGDRSGHYIKGNNL